MKLKKINKFLKKIC